jgi:hypothetical protein
MRFSTFTKSLAPVAAIMLATALSACDRDDTTINGGEGKKLSDFDLSGPPPKGLTLLGPDHIKVRNGKKLAITINGDPAIADELRFTLKGGSLGILRKANGSKDGAVTVNVTMPPPEEITLAGSGTIETGALAPSAKVTIAGSGKLDAGPLSGESLNLTIAGSGSMHGAGTVRDLRMALAGSGDGNLGELKVEKANITIAGTGKASFASDGEVSADIMGSGQVTVKGRARCKVSAMGSGRLICESGEPTA